jgi:hypothetical protein
MMMAVLYLIYSVGRCWINPALGPPHCREEEIPEDRSYVLA